MIEIFDSLSEASHEILSDKDPHMRVSGEDKLMNQTVASSLHKITDAGYEKIWHDMPVEQRMFAVVRSGQREGRSYSGLSMGQLGAAVYKSNPLMYGQVKKVCANGLCFDYIGNPVEDSMPDKMDILAPNLNLVMEDIRFDVVLDIEIQNHPPFDLFTFRQMAVTFVKLGICHKKRWDRFIRNVSIFNLSKILN